MVHNQHSELTSILGDLENIQLNNEGSQQDLHTSSIVINRDSNFGNTYLSKEFAHVLGPGQIVTSLEPLAQCRGGSSLNTWHSAEIGLKSIISNSCIKGNKLEVI
jgi:hypothetical protein